MKNLVFSTKVVLDGMPDGFSGRFKMLHLETGQLYNYRVHIPKHIYVGTQIPGMGSREEDLKWWQCMFYSLTRFIEAFNSEYGHLPTDINKYQDRRSYTSDCEPFGKKIIFVVDPRRLRSLEDSQLVIIDHADAVLSQAYSKTYGKNAEDVKSSGDFR
ncbi:hypothetical protein [Dyadobacter psychrophilus]|uniref:Uncharacterized protein n=1 Tax=Dyadobacter psychrophilus TaxID=651661 RepID=A0A1T5EQD3_9BACT|nr:hypothetical protein [Dyadobacter psychrophilus]SKB86126.1 hypothetical protein SAMN05660293_02682 [Dyadobacter psychrophilus]